MIFDPVRKAANCMDNLSTKETILFVDDEQVILKVCSLMIEELGYDVLQAENGKKATQIFRDKNDVISLVILDIKLPDENGSDTCKRLNEINSDVKILHISGLGREQGMESLDCGCNDFLRKPFRIEELSNKLKGLLDNTSE
jgi:DNA-binding response OmpR family regulator